jgi:hypothetical protein
MTIIAKIVMNGLLVFILNCASDSLPTVKTNNKEMLDSYSCPNSDCPTRTARIDSSVHIEIDPSAAGGLPQQIFNISVPKDLPAQFEVKPHCYYHGLLTVHEFLKNNMNRLKYLSKSDIVAFAPDIIAIPKIDEDLSESATAILAGQQNNSSSAVDASTGYFRLSLIADRKYEIIINPEGKNSLPPTFLSVQISEEHRETIVLKNEGSIVAGQVSFPVPLSADLISTTTVKIFQDKKLVSSVGKLTSSGNYFVQLSSPLYNTLSKNHKLTLVIEPNAEHDYLPVIRQKLSLKEAELTGKTIHLEPIAVNSIQQEYTKTITIINNQGESIKGARIYLKRKLDGHYIEKQEQTDDQGQVQLKLLRGSYSLAVIAPQDSIHGMYRHDNWKVENTDAATITLPFREELSGTMLDYKGNPVNGAVIQLTRIAQEDSTTLENVLRKTSTRIEARSNDAGAWCAHSLGGSSEECVALRLDQGRYRIFITPPPGEKLSNQTMTIDFPTTNSIAVTLNRPTQIRGRVVDPNSKAPVSKAFIKIFSASVQLESGEPLLLGQAITDEQGEFSAFIYLNKK